MMKLIVAMVVLLPSFALAQQPVPKPPGPGGSCPHGYASSGSFCAPSLDPWLGPFLTFARR